MQASEAKVKLNQLASDYFKPSLGLSFDVIHGGQIEVTTQNPLYRMTPKKKESLVLIDRLSPDSNPNDFDWLMDFLEQSRATARVDWEDHLKAKEVSKEVVKVAENELKEHFDRSQTLYVEPLKQLVDNYIGDKEFLFKTWEKEFKQQGKVLKKIKKLEYKRTVRKKESRGKCFIETVFGIVDFEPMNSTEEFIIKDSSELRLIQETLRCFPEIASFIYLMEQLNRQLDGLKTKVITAFSKSKKKEQYKSLYNCQEEFLKRFNLQVSMKELLIYLNGTPLRVETQGLSENEKLLRFEEALVSETDKLKKKIESNFKAKLGEYEKLSQGDSSTKILTVVEASPKKGITTYIDILKGDQSPKIIQNDYHKLNGYSTLVDWTKAKIRSEIEALAEQGFLSCQTFKASFGRYDGYVLTKKGKDFLTFKEATPSISSEATLTYPTMKTWADFESALTEFDLHYHLKGLLNEYAQNGAIALTEIPQLAEFVAKERSLYKEEEALFIQTLKTILDRDQKDYLYLQAQFEARKTKETLLAICETMSN